MRYLVCTVFVAGLMACSNGAEPVRKLDCAPIKNLETIIKAGDPKIIIIGEIHGMKEPPELAAAMICHSLNAGYKTTLALEIDDRDGNHQAYVQSKGTRSDVEAYFRDETWTSSFVDGRSSLAMFGLIDYARSLASQGSDLNVNWFRTLDYSVMPKNDRSAQNQFIEKQMADNILKGIKQRRGEKTIVLVGNLHARTDRAERGDVSYDYMAKHLVGSDMMTFDTTFSGGSGWNCQGPSPADCGANRFGGNYHKDSRLFTSSEFEIILNDDPNISDVKKGHYSPKAFNGIIHLGEVLASPPANPDGREKFEVSQ